MEITETDKEKEPTSTCTISDRTDIAGFRTGHPEGHGKLRHSVGARASRDKLKSILNLVKRLSVEG